MIDNGTFDLIRTRRLTLRRPVPTDLPFVIALFARPELTAHRPDPTPDPPEASEARLNRDMLHWQARGFGRWTAEHEGAPIGFGGVTATGQAGVLNASYHLHPDHWGAGYATEILTTAVALAFAHLAPARIVGLARPANQASQRVLERAGFVRSQEVDLGGASSVTFILERVPSL